MRRLVVSFIITIGNYDYAFYWYLYQDGTIEAEVKLTGIMITQGLAGQRHRLRGRGRRRPGGAPPPALLLRPARHRGRRRRATRSTRSTLRPSNEEDQNPYGNAFRPVATRLERESEAHRSVDPFSGRYWMIVNDSVHNALGQPVAYRLLPGETTLSRSPERTLT